MLIDIKELGKYDAAVSQIYYSYNVIRQPRLIESKQKRAVFIYIYTGKISVEIDGERQSFNAGSLIYFPHGYHRKMMTDTAPTRYCRMDLALRIDGEIALFSEIPTKIEGYSLSDLKSAIEELRDACQESGIRLLRCEKMLKLLSVLSDPGQKPINPKLKAAVEYINANFMEKIDCKKLASMCFLGTAQFYNLFNESLGQTPLQYRNSLLIQRAKRILSSGESSVSEAAERLGFSDAAYFSRFFKKQTGYSPLSYMENNSHR